MNWLSNKFAASLLLTGLTAGANAQAEASAQGTNPTSDQSFAVHCGRLLTGDGKEYKNGWLLVRNGKVVSAGDQEPPAGTRTIDALSRVVMPGIVAVDTDLAPANDDAYAVTPDALAIDGFDFELRLRDALEGGVTTAYLSPGRQRLISGQGAIIKTSGDDLVERILSENACLRVNFGDGGVSAPAVFEPTIHPTDDDPLVPARVQTPTARIGMLPELRALFAEARRNAEVQGEGTIENRYDPSALRAAVVGQMPVRAAAWKATDIRRALMLQKELGLTMVLENPQHIAPLAEQAQAQSVAATFRVPAQPGRRTPGSEDRRQKRPEPRLDAPARAAAAGMTIGLAPSAGVPLRDYLMAVGLAVRGGLPVDNALRAIGTDAAKVLGVEDRVGVLAPGKDADFIVLSGDPLAIGTMVESTWVDGKRAYERKNEQTLLAIRCGKILDGEGRVYRDGVLVVQGSRIKAIGEDLAIPYGARVIDLGSAVMTPGFVDAFSHLGLAGDGQGVPNGASSQLLVEAIPHDDPMFEAALAAGITTVLTSGKDGGLVSGRITAVKTGAADRDAMVVRDIAGQRMVFNAIGPDAEKPLRDQLERGKKYAKSWADYEKALQEWSGKKPTKAPEPAPEPTPESTEKPAAADPVSGTWEANIDLGPFQLTMFFDLQLAGTKVTGQVRITVRDRERPPQDISSGSYKDGTLTLEFDGMGGETTLTGKIEKDTLTATVAMGPMGEQEITAKRISKSGAPKPTAKAPTSRPKRKKDEDDGKPKPPKTDEGLEPLRAVIENRAALVVRTDRGASIAKVVTLLEEAKVPYVLQGAEGAVDDTAVLEGKRPPILLEPDMVRRDGNKLVNSAAVLADIDVPLLFGTGSCADARYLPLHAAYAVRYGLGPDEALAAVTANTAEAFKIDDRIGSLAKGKDADFVVFSGDPFEPTSRVLLVGCNGEIAIDHREEDQ